MSLGQIEMGVEREPRFYRYTVRADRQLNDDIRRAAAHAGISVEAFVQAHFDRILDMPSADMDGRELPDAASLARKRGLPVLAARIYLALAARAVDGFATRSLDQISADVGSNNVSVGRAIATLMGDGLLADAGIGRQGRRYRVADL